MKQVQCKKCKCYTEATHQGTFDKGATQVYQYDCEECGYGDVVVNP